MKKLFSVLKYTKNYKGYTFLNIVFNILFAVFSAAMLALIGPFSELLFKTDPEALRILTEQGPPEFSFSSHFFQNFSSYYLASLIVVQGKAYTLILICVAVFILAFLKNISRYFEIGRAHV